MRLGFWIFVGPVLGLFILLSVAAFVTALAELFVYIAVVVAVVVFALQMLRPHEPNRRADEIRAWESLYGRRRKW